MVLYKTRAKTELKPTFTLTTNNVRRPPHSINLQYRICFGTFPSTKSTEFIYDLFIVQVPLAYIGCQYIKLTFTEDNTHAVQ